MTESRPRTRRRLVTRLYGLAARINHDRLNDAQLAYLTAVLDHYNHAIKGMTDD
ncbi:hypothetical protein PWF70_13500 [Gordonia sp. Swx-4]|uniref:hypothetical protein n=1 Tax=Gordonia sp. Swx-4 TaxID=3029399 RepID=UPI002573FE87|nr:hypothetical protein [Gordonia sp. Swx-4]WJG11646.1 hypothetical protein PWF70_13500 [Gordonia sp. Swx-4]